MLPPPPGEYKQRTIPLFANSFWISSRMNTESNSRDGEYGVAAESVVVARSVDTRGRHLRNAVTQQRFALPHHARVHRLVVHDVGQLVERLVDEDDRDEAGEALLRETGNVAHQETQLERDDHHQRNHHPEPDPETKRDEWQTVVPTQHRWLAGVTVRCQTHDRQVVGSTLGRVTIKWLLLGWVTVCRQVVHFSI